MIRTTTMTKTNSEMTAEMLSGAKPGRMLLSSKVVTTAASGRAHRQKVSWQHCHESVSLHHCKARFCRQRCNSMQGVYSVHLARCQIVDRSTIQVNAYTTQQGMQSRC